MRTQLSDRLSAKLDAAAQPTHMLADGARYLRLPVSTIRSWVVGRDYETESGKSHSPPLVRAADPHVPLLSFLNLVELHVISSIRRVHQVRPRAVRRAIKYLEKTLHSDHPLLDEQMLTDGKCLFIEQYGELVNVSEQGQLQMRIALDAYLNCIEWNADGIPIRLYPFSRSRFEKSPQLIVIDPRIRAGKPCIAGTRVPTNIIAERHEAGDSISLLAEDYGRAPQEIEEALRYESRAAA